MIKKIGMLGALALALSVVSPALAAETPTNGYRYDLVTPAGTFTYCGEFGRVPKCNGEAEAPDVGGMVHQAIRTPTGRVIYAFPMGTIDGGIVDGMVQMKGGVYVVTQYAIHRYDSSTDTFVQVYTNTAVRISTPRGGESYADRYLPMHDARGYSVFEGLLRLDDDGSWHTYRYEGPTRRSAEKIEADGAHVKIIHFESGDVTVFDPSVGSFSN